MEQMRSEAINWEMVTVGDLLEKFEFKNETVVLGNGKVEPEGKE